MSDVWPSGPPVVVPLEELPPQPSPSRIKVLHVITRFEAGAGANTLLSAIGMDRDRYDVWIAGCEGGLLWERAARAGISTFPLSRLRHEVSPVDDLAVLVELIRLMRSERFAIVHTHSAKGGFLGRLAGWLSRTPVVLYTLHGRDPWWPAGSDASDPNLDGFMSRPRRRTFLFLERVLRPVTDGFIAVSPRVARAAIEAGIGRPGSVDVAPSAVEFEAIPAAADTAVRTELGIPRDIPLVGTMGRLDAQKAPLDFVRMAALVAAERPDARFVMVGDGALEHAIRSEARRLGVEILLTGFRVDAPRVASAFDVFVVSSLYEGVGRSVTEALASARPVVATAVDGVVDLVRPGSTGLLAPARDPEALAVCVLWLLDHPEEARRMAEQGRERVRTLFDPALMCSILDRTYSRYLGMASSTALDLSDGSSSESPAGDSGLALNGAEARTALDGARIPIMRSAHG